MNAHAAVNLEAETRKQALKRQGNQRVNNMQNLDSFTKIIFIDMSHRNCF